MAFHRATKFFHFVHTMNKPLQEICDDGCVFGGKAAGKDKKTKTMKKQFADKTIRARLRSWLPVAALLALNVMPAFAQSTSFNSTTLQTGISNSLAVIMMFGFVLGIFSVIYGGFAIRRGDVDQGKMSILGGAIIAAAPAVVYAFYKIFGLDSSSAVGVGSFN
jgi:uncharacterized membrane protein YozB (DUF420 family)